jgi:hypothetical protein
MSPSTESIDAPHERSAANGIGVGIGVMIAAYFVFLPFVLIVVAYLFLTGYAIVRAIGPGAGENAVPIVVGFVLITTVFVVLLGVAIHFIGRSFTPKRSRSSD